MNDREARRLLEKKYERDLSMQQETEKAIDAQDDRNLLWLLKQFVKRSWEAIKPWLGPVAQTAEAVGKLAWELFLYVKKKFERPLDRDNLFG